MTTKCTTDHITRTFSVSFALICLIVKYNSFYVKSDTVKSLMEQLQCIYDNLKDNNEIAIINRYGDIAKRFTIMFTIAVSSGLFIIIGAELYPYFINIVSPANESQPRQIPMLLPIEYFVDQEKYFFLLLFHLNATVCISLTALIAIGTMLIAFLQHACGILKIASYRIQNTIQIYIQSLNRKNKNLVCNNLIYAINIHRNAVMFSERLISEFEITFMLLIVFGIMSLSLNTFRIFSSKYNMDELPLTFLLTSILFVYMFLANFIGQEIIDHYGLIFVATYEIQWYITPLYIQKLILFLLLRGNKSFGLNVGGLFISSLECFATLANATLSYVIVMYSTIQ